MTLLNFTAISLKHFHPPTRNETDAPMARLRIQANMWEANLRQESAQISRLQKFNKNEEKK